MNAAVGAWTRPPSSGSDSTGRSLSGMVVQDRDVGTIEVGERHAVSVRHLARIGTQLAEVLAPRHDRRDDETRSRREVVESSEHRGRVEREAELLVELAQRGLLARSRRRPSARREAPTVRRGLLSFADRRVSRKQARPCSSGASVTATAARRAPASLDRRPVEAAEPRFDPLAQRRRRALRGKTPSKRSSILPAFTRALSRRAEARRWISTTPRRKPTFAARAGPSSSRTPSGAKAAPGVWRWQGKMSLADAVARAREWQGKKADAGFACIHWPKEHGGAGPLADARHHLRPGGVELRSAARVRRARPEHLRAADRWPTPRDRAEEALPAQDGARRGDLVPALLRAGRRLRPRRAAHARGARRRRVGGQRPEGLELGRPLLRLGDPGDAPRRRPSPSTRDSPSSSST